MVCLKFNIVLYFEQNCIVIKAIIYVVRGNADLISFTVEEANAILKCDLFSSSAEFLSLRNFICVCTSNTSLFQLYNIQAISKFV